MGLEQTRPDKYFICFGFQNFCQADLKPFHVTLIYFGALTDEKLKEVTNCVDQFLNEKDVFATPECTLAFYHTAMFGPNQDVRVLLPSETFNLEIFKNEWKELREKLEELTSYKGYPFNPHLTTDLHLYKGNIDSIYLCKNEYEVIEAWDLT
jgi:2'-5' RNA ligase